MEEGNKKKNKISLSTYILVLAMLVIAVMAVFIYMQKVNANREIEGLKNDAEVLKNTVAELQGKLDSISNIANTSNEEQNTANSNSQSFTDTEIKKCIQNYLKLLGAFYGETEDMLGENGLGFKQSEYSNNTSADKSSNFITTKILYSDFKNEINKYMTDKCFENSTYSEFFKEENGYLCYKFRGATGATYELKNYKISGNKYIADVDFIQEEDTSNCEFEFEIVKNNGNIVIDYCKQTKP